MVKRKDLTPEQALAEMRRLAAAGKVVIRNAAAADAGSVVVKSYVRHKSRTFPEDERGVFVIDWSRAGVGFGQLTLTAKNGKLYADTECMSDAFVLDILAQALREREEM